MFRALPALWNTSILTMTLYAVRKSVVARNENII